MKFDLCGLSAALPGVCGRAADAPSARMPHQPRPATLASTEAFTTTRDGIKLAANVYVPRRTGPPVILRNARPI